jgi:polyferredoxin
MSANNSLQDIPIHTESLRPDRRLHWQRRSFQWLTILLLLVIPISGLFRIDPVDGAFVVLDRQVWFADFYIVVGLWLTISCLLVITYSLVGTAFCGWACPQNTMAEWANLMTNRLLGRRAEVSLDGTAMRVSKGKNKALNWLLLGLMFMLVSMLAALVPLLYFYAPDIIWSFVSFRDDARLAPSLYWIYTIFVLIMFLNVAFIRHFWCRFMCIYRVWQHSFKTRETLRVVHDHSHPDECERCNFCVTACFVDIDPRHTDTFDSCINCGECINACNQVRAGRKTGTSLLRFEIGQQTSSNQDNNQRSRVGKNVDSILTRAPWALLLAGFGLTMFVWGISHYQPYHMSVYRAETLQGDTLVDYRIQIANKMYRPAHFTISVEGLPQDSYQLSSPVLQMSSTGREDLSLRLSESLPKGLHPFLVRVQSDAGWQSSFRVQHFSSGD